MLTVPGMPKSLSSNILYLDQSFGQKFFQQAHQIAFTTLGFDVIFINNRAADILNSSRILHQAPDACAYGVQSIIDAALDVQDGGFPREIAGMACTKNCSDSGRSTDQSDLAPRFLKMEHATSN